jgi:hypothetical protein
MQSDVFSWSFRVGTLTFFLPFLQFFWFKTTSLPSHRICWSRSTRTIDIVFIRYVQGYLLWLGSFSYIWLLSCIHCKTWYLLVNYPAFRGMMLSFLLVVVVPDTTTPHIIDIVFIRYVKWHPLCLGSFSYIWLLSCIHYKTWYLLVNFMW